MYNYQWNLLYNLQRDGSAQRTFIEKVHGHSNVICIIETEGGNICGGYTSTGWNGTYNKTRTYSRDRKAFLFNFKSDRFFFSYIQPDWIDNALWYDKKDFCCFGSDGTLYVTPKPTITVNKTYVYQSFPNKRYLLGGKCSAEVINIEVYQLQKDSD